MVISDHTGYLKHLCAGGKHDMGWQLEARQDITQAAYVWAAEVSY